MHVYAASVNTSLKRVNTLVFETKTKKKKNKRQFSKQLSPKDGDYSYRVCSLDMGLQVQGWVEIAAGVAGASTLDGVHAHGDVAIRACSRKVCGMGKAALAPFASTALELTAHLQQDQASPHQLAAISSHPSRVSTFYIYIYIYYNANSYNYSYKTIIHFAV